MTENYHYSEGRWHPCPAHIKCHVGGTHAEETYIETAEHRQDVKLAHKSAKYLFKKGNALVLVAPSQLENSYHVYVYYDGKGVDFTSRRMTDAEKQAQQSLPPLPSGAIRLSLTSIKDRTEARELALAQLRTFNEVPPKKIMVHQFENEFAATMTNMIIHRELIRRRLSREMFRPTSATWDSRRI